MTTTSHDAETQPSREGDGQASPDSSSPPRASRWRTYLVLSVGLCLAIPLLIGIALAVDNHRHEPDSNFLNGPWTGRLDAQGCPMLNRLTPEGLVKVRALYERTEPASDPLTIVRTRRRYAGKCARQRDGSPVWGIAVNVPCLTLYPLDGKQDPWEGHVTWFQDGRVIYIEHGSRGQVRVANFTDEQFVSELFPHLESLDPLTVVAPTGREGATQNRAATSTSAGD